MDKDRHTPFGGIALAIAVIGYVALPIIRLSDTSQPIIPYSTNKVGGVESSELEKKVSEVKKEYSGWSWSSLINYFSKTPSTNSYKKSE
jgi:hypothetical protein